MGFSCNFRFLLGVWLYVLIMLCTCFRVNPHSIVAWMSRNFLLNMESFPPGRQRGDNFIGLWGTLNFHLPRGSLAKWGAQIFQTWGGGGRGAMRFSLLGDGGSPSPTGLKFTHASTTRKSPDSKLTHKFLFPSSKVHPPTK